MSEIIEISERLSNSVAQLATAVRGRSASIPNTFNQPYKTTERFNGKIVWAVRLNVGALPNTTTKIVTIPTIITNTWGPVSERQLDLLNCFAWNNSEEILPLPFVSVYTRNNSAFTDGFGESIIVTLNANTVRILTESNRTNYTGVVTIKYTRN